MRALHVTAAAAVLSFAVAAPASGHAELVPHQLPPGASGELLLLVTHGCGGDDESISTEPVAEEPMTALTVQAPLELDIVPGEIAGWNLTSETDPAGRVVRARWVSDDPAGSSETLQVPLDVTVADVPDGSEIWLPVVQECAGGSTRSWTLEGDTRGGDEVPAMRLIANADAAVPPTGRGVTGPTWPTRLAWPSILVALLGTGGLVHALRKRRGSTYTSH